MASLSKNYPVDAAEPICIIVSVAYTPIYPRAIIARDRAKRSGVSGNELDRRMNQHGFTTKLCKGLKEEATGIVLAAWADAAGVSVEWLITGRGPMIPRAQLDVNRLDDRADTAASFAKMCGYTDAEVSQARETIAAYPDAAWTIEQIFDEVRDVRRRASRIEKVPTVLDASAFVSSVVSSDESKAPNAPRSPKTPKGR